ncbi:c-type cytochrome [Spongorhabdus nitratireducens]
MKKSVVLMLSLLALPGISMAAGDAAAGKAKAGVCAACHGANGKAIMPAYPNLAGQNQAYLETALKAYKNGQRTGGMSAVMVPQAKMLTDKDISNLAAYFSGL